MLLQLLSPRHWRMLPNWAQWVEPINRTCGLTPWPHMYEADAARSLRPALFCQGLAILAFAIGFLAALTQCLLERGARRGFPGRPR